MSAIIALKVIFKASVWNKDLKKHPENIETLFTLHQTFPQPP